MKSDMDIVDPNTEAYCEAYVAAGETLEDSWPSELEKIVSQREVGTPGSAAEDSYALLTRLLLATEARLRDLLARRTTDVWLLQSRRHLACGLLFSPPKQSLEFALLFWIHQAKIPRAVALFAAPGNTSLPDGGGTFEVPASPELSADLQVLTLLCRLHEELLVGRRRLLIGGTLAWDGSQPVVTLPPEVEARLTLITERQLQRPTGILSRSGLHLAPLELSREQMPEGSSWVFFFVAGHVAFDEMTKHGERRASDVRPFGPVWHDARSVLEELQVVEGSVRRHWGLSPLEIVSAALTVCLFVRNRYMRPETKLTTEYTLETRAVFSIDRADMEEYLEKGIPIVSQALAGTVVPGDRRLVQAFLQHFAGSRAAESAEERAAIQLAGPIPFLFRVGEKFLIDLFSLPLAFSSLVSCIELESDAKQIKGLRFEDDVRRVLLDDPEIRPVQTLERKFADGGRVLGEADVVVQASDTAFLVECKSRRFRGIDDCDSFEQAKRRTRDIVSWVEQARRTARYVAEHPSGHNYRVPADINWIVPLVCSAIVELVREQDQLSLLAEDDLPIAMTPAEIRDFVRSRRWERERSRITQYRVAR